MKAESIFRVLVMLLLLALAASQSGAVADDFAGMVPLAVVARVDKPAAGEVARSRGKNGRIVG